MMSTFIRNVVDGLANFFELTGRARLRRELLQYSNRTLEDMGFSRELLEAGIEAWPWRTGLQAPVTGAEYRQAVKELSAYSDAELADLGLSRPEIKYAVRYGRIGIDIPHSEAA